VAFNFTVPDEQADASRKWRKEHNKVCKIEDVGAIGGKFTWSFTPTSLGCILVLKCICGEKLDLTDYDNW
jgi:hypothetical protein